jgi:adenosylcobinamide-phosphate synthase
MGFLALILALALEQGRPLPRDNAVHRAAARVADAIARSTDAGHRRHGAIGWGLAVGAAVLAVAFAEWLLGAIGVLAVLALHVAVLYHTVGFRQFSHAFTEIQLALAANDTEGARQALQRWIRQSDPGFVVADLPVDELCRIAIAHALVAAHRHVFGPLFWYLLLPGAIGPVIYRAAQFLADRWGAGARDVAGLGPSGAPTVPASPSPATSTALVPVALQGPAGEAYGRFADRAYRVLDWLPVRLAAVGFAIVGNFEDAAYCWRAAAAVRGGDEQRRILLMAGGGALGLRIADPRIEAELRGEAVGIDPDAGAAGSGPQSGFEWSGSSPDAAGLRSAVGLVWRAVVLWIGLFAMLTIANWLGR